MSMRQHDRLATESSEEREARLCHRREQLEEQRVHQRERACSSQLIRQPSVQAKMRTFHAHFATLTSPRCSTCSESFPGVQLCPPSTECVRCFRDNRTPKLYSSQANNMPIRPGPLPPQHVVYSVQTFVTFILTHLLT